MKLDIVNGQNEKVGALELNEEIFGGRIKTDLIWESVVQQNAAERSGTHATKNRALEDIITDAHTLLETWITERPAQWLWLHRRWKEDANFWPKLIRERNISLD